MTSAPVSLRPRVLQTDCLSHLTSLERRTTCRHFPEFEGMPLQVSDQRDWPRKEGGTVTSVLSLTRSHRA